MSKIIVLIDTLIVITTVMVLAYILHLTFRETKKGLFFIKRAQLFFSGALAFIFDTIGVGSFAVSIALAKQFKTFEDHELPAVLNIIQVLPGAIEAILFLKFVPVDAITLLVLVTATCIGGAIGVYRVTSLNQQAIRVLMLISFPVMIILLLAENYQWLPIGGEAQSLRGLPLMLGFIGLLFAGMLTAAGIGLFAVTQAILFLLGMSPIVAFPIMTAAAALQQPISATLFIKRSKVPLRHCMLIMVGGVLGVALAMPLLSFFTMHQLRTLLIVVLGYNTLRLYVSFRVDQKKASLSTLTHENRADHEKA